MPYKMCCDRCGKETSKNFVSNRAIIMFEGWKLEVMVCNPFHVWNEGILCETCIQTALKQGCFRQKNDYDFHRLVSHNGQTKQMDIPEEGSVA